MTRTYRNCSEHIIYCQSLDDMSKPNILVTGTPGVGKSYLCDRLATKLNLNLLDVSKIAKEKNFLSEYDDDFSCPVINEEQLLDFLEPLVQQGGNIIEYHGCDFFPERWFNAVFVVTCQNTILYDRLKNRGYSEKKIKSNIECEIFGVILEEAIDSYKKNIVYELKSETEEDLEKNIKTVEDWYERWNSK